MTQGDCAAKQSSDGGKTMNHSDVMFQVFLSGSVRSSGPWGIVMTDGPLVCCKSREYLAINQYRCRLVSLHSFTL